MANILIQKPSIQGEIKYRPFFQEIDNAGSTFPTLFLGHADAERMREPYKVVDMQQAINFLGGNEASPLVQGLLEAYNHGCRNIWIYAVAPMADYYSDLSDRKVPQAELGGLTFYEKYAEDLAQAYAFLKTFPEFDYVVPLEASFVDNNAVDFITPLNNLCENQYAGHGRNVIGILGTRAESYNDSTVAEAVSEVQSVSPSIGRNLLLVYGEGLVANRQTTQSRVYSYAGPVASMCSTLNPSLSIAGKTISTVATPTFPDLTEAQVDTLVQAKINPIVRTQVGKRGRLYQTYLLTSNSLAADGSDYWSLDHNRLVNFVANGLRDIGQLYIGSTQRNAFEAAVGSYFDTLVSLDYARAIRHSFLYTTLSIDRAEISVEIQPYGTIKKIYFSVETGPGA